MSEEHRREFGRDGVSGLVDRDRALRAKLLPRRPEPPVTPETISRIARHAGKK